MNSPEDALQRRILGEQAAKHLVELAEGGGERRAAFIAWIKESPRHVEEFLLASATMGAFRRQRKDEGAREEIERLIADAVAERSGLRNVVRLQEEANALPLTPTRRPQWERAKKIRVSMAAGVAALALIAGGVWWAALKGGPGYATGVGEQRTVRLADGSFVHLNARSRIEVDFSAEAREIRLARGEAIFKVEHDAVRPFRVRAGDAVIQALGTQFNVYRRPEGTTVSVLEGKVRVTTDEATSSSSRASGIASRLGSINLTVGEQASIATSGSIEKRAVPDVSRAVAWRERRLVFRADRLEEIAEEFNRYSPRRIEPLDARARNQRITGTFNADDPESLVLFLEKLDGLEVERSGEGFRIRARD
jgi:transmembrane sensor